MSSLRPPPEKQTEDPTTGYYFTEIHRHDTYPYIDSKDRNMSGRYVFIAGASRGIGYEIALSFARAGAAGIAVGSQSKCAELEREIQKVARGNGKGKVEVLAMRVDVTRKEDVQEAAEKVKWAFPRLDVLVCNAGVLEKRGKIGECDVEEWVRTMDVNLKGTFYCMHYFMPILAAGVAGNGSGLGAVVNINSLASQSISPGASAYQVSKLAQLRLTEFVTRDYGDKGLVGYAVHPGGVATRLGRSLPVERHSALTETARLCADTVVWLVEGSREWLGGRYLMAQWDMEEVVRRKEEIVEENKLVVRLRL